MNNIEQLQAKVDKMLKWGIIFSLIWLAGLGSITSIILAIRARKIIKKSNELVEGTGKIWWCFIVGGIGIIFWLGLLIMASIS